MSEIIGTVLEKISSYNLLNYFLPGILLCIILKYIVGYNILVGTDLENILICYFVGLINNRISSLWGEKFLIKTKFLKFADYSDYVKAENNDDTGKLIGLSAVNNSYRSYTTVFFICFIVQLVKLLMIRVVLCIELIKLIVILMLLILFMFSYKKQTEYITERIDGLLSIKSIHK